MWAETISLFLFIVALSLLPFVILMIIAKAIFKIGHIVWTLEQILKELQWKNSR